MRRQKEEGGWGLESKVIEKSSKTGRLYIEVVEYDRKNKNVEQFLKQFYLVLGRIIWYWGAIFGTGEDNLVLGRKSVWYRRVSPVVPAEQRAPSPKAES